MRFKFYALVVIAVSAFASCKKSGLSKPAVKAGNVLVLNAAEQQKAVTDNTFSFKLFNNLASANSGGDNLFLSPLSISIVMAMTSNGANGQTLTAIDSAMDFNNFSQSQLNAYYNKLITQLPAIDSKTTINIANSVWYRQGFSVLPQFINTNSNFYKAEVSALDFSSPSAINTINNWVSDHTNGKIPTIVNSIPSDEEMYLINALYFKSTWQESFDPSKTQAAPFYVKAGNTVQTQFMNGVIDVNSYYDANVTVFELPYSGDKYSMVIVQPQSGKTLADIISGLDGAQWNTWMNALKSTVAQVSLPKFAYSYNTSLNSALTAFGMGVAFSDNADFSKISSTRLKISDVKHKAYIAVDEAGTEAAAVTSVGATVTDYPQIAPNYNVNHPFIFAIRERNSGLVVFAGLVNNPLLTSNQ
jgi:serpin B